MVGQEVLIQIDIEVQKLSLGKCQCLLWLFRTRSSFYFDFRLFLAGIGSHWHRLLVGGSLGRVLLVLQSDWLLVLLSSWLLVLLSSWLLVVWLLLLLLVNRLRLVLCLLVGQLLRLHLLWFSVLVPVLIISERIDKRHHI